MTQQEFLVQIAEILEGAGVPYMVAGSHGSSWHGLPRSTQDVDLVIDASAQQLEKLLVPLADRYYVSPECARDALRHRSMFNVIDFKSGTKADLIIRKDRPFSVEEFSRRQAGTVLGKAIPFATAEDVILSKLEWDKITPSERQVRDALNVAKVKWPVLDVDYLRKWAVELQVSQKLEELLSEAKA